MKPFLLIVACLATFAQGGAPWKTLRIEGAVFLENQKNSEIRIPIVVTSASGGFRMVVKSANKDIDLLIYESGDTGTQVIITELRAVVFNKKTGKALADFPWKYISRQKDREPIQPRWTLLPDSIKVEDESLGIVRTLSF